MAECRVWDRKRWQSERTTYKIPKGAGGIGVSVGDALDKFHKERAKNHQSALKACDPLEKQLTSYAKKVAKLKPSSKGERYADWAKLVESRLIGNLKDYKRGLQQEAQAVQQYPRVYAQAVADLREIKTEREEWTGDGTFVPTNAKDAAANFGKLAGWATVVASSSPALSMDAARKHHKAFQDLEAVGWTMNVLNQLARTMQAMLAHL